MSLHHHPAILVRHPPVAQAGIGMGGPQYNHRQQCIIGGSGGIGQPVPHSMADLGLRMEDGLGVLESTIHQALYDDHQGLHHGTINSNIWGNNGTAENLALNDTRQPYGYSYVNPGTVPNPLVIGNSSQHTYTPNNYSYGTTAVRYNHGPMPCGPYGPQVSKEGHMGVTNLLNGSKTVVMQNSAEPNNWSMVGTVMQLGREQPAPLRTDTVWVGGEPLVPVVPNPSTVNRVGVVPVDQGHSAFGYHFMDNRVSSQNTVQTSQVLEPGTNRVSGYACNTTGSVSTKWYVSNENRSHPGIQPVNGEVRSVAQPGVGANLNHHAVIGKSKHQGPPAGTATGSSKLQMALAGGNSFKVMDESLLKQYLDERLHRAEEVQRVLTEAQKDLRQAPMRTGAVEKTGSTDAAQISRGKAKKLRRKGAVKGSASAVDPSVEAGHGTMPLIDGEAEEIVVEVDLPDCMFLEDDENTDSQPAVADEGGGVSMDENDSNGPHAEPQTLGREEMEDNRRKDRRKRHSTSWHRTWDPKMSVLVLKRVKDGVGALGKGGVRPSKDSRPSVKLPRRTQLLDNGKLQHLNLKECYIPLVRCDAPGGAMYRNQGVETKPCTTAEVVPSHGDTATECHQTAPLNKGNEPEQLPPANPTQEPPPVLPPSPAEVDSEPFTKVDPEPCTKVNREQDYWLQMLDRERREALEALEAVRKRLDEERAANKLALDTMRNSLLSKATDQLDERQWMLLEEEFRKREIKRKRASLSEDDGGVLSSSGEDTSQSGDLEGKSEGIACTALALRCPDSNVISSGDGSGPVGPCVPMETSGSRRKNSYRSSECGETWSSIRDDRIMELQRRASKERRSAVRHGTKECSVRLEKCDQTDVRFNSLEMRTLEVTTGPVAHGDSGCVSRTSIVCLQGRVGISRTGFAAKEGTLVRTQMGAQGAISTSQSTILMVEMQKLVVVVKNVNLEPGGTTGVVIERPSLCTEGSRRSLRNRQPLLAIAGEKLQSSALGKSTVGRRISRHSGAKAIAAPDMNLKPCYVRLVRCDQTTECSPVKKRRK